MLRAGKVGMRFRKPGLTPVVVLLLALVVVAVAGPAQAQAGADTTVRSDTLGATRRPTGDSVASMGADSTRPKPDSVGTPEPPPAPAAPPKPAIDSAFNAACHPPPPDAPAASLLLVTFSPTLTERERLDLAKRVGGTLAGVAATGEQYLRVSGGGSTRTAADSLILYQGVVQVSERSCAAVAPGAQ